MSILHKSIAGRYRPVRVADGPITARCRFIKNASRDMFNTSLILFMTSHHSYFSIVLNYFVSCNESKFRRRPPLVFFKLVVRVYFMETGTIK